MVFLEVQFKNERLDPRDHKAALKILGNSAVGTQKGKPAKILTQQDFVAFKRVLELYMKKLRLVVRKPVTDTTSVTNTATQTNLEDSETTNAEATQEMNANLDQNDVEELETQYTYEDLARFCRKLRKHPVDLLVDEYDPKEVTQKMMTEEKLYLKLSEDVDETIADDILGLNPADMNSLSSIIGDYRTCLIMRRLGRSYYLALDSRRQIQYKELLQLQWLETESILEFNHNIKASIDSCVELGVQTNVVDQIMIYFTKLSIKRSENPIWFTATSSVKSTDCETLIQAMEKVAGTILHHSPEGKIPYDGPTISYIQGPSLAQTRSEKPKMNNGKQSRKIRNTVANKKFITCCFCGLNVSDIKEHNKECKATGHKCGTCSETGHLEKVCTTHRAERKSLKSFRQRINRRKHKDTTIQQDQDAPRNYSVNPDPPTGIQGLTKLFTTSSCLVTMDCNYSLSPTYGVRFGVDTCSSCMAFSDVRYFDFLDDRNTGTIHLLDKTASYSGIGIVSFSFTTNSPTYRFPAYFVPDAHLPILSNMLLHKAGITPNHDPEDPSLTLTDGTKVKMEQTKGISTVTVVPPRSEFTGSTIIAKETPELWHRRFMHAPKELLVKLNLARVSDNLKLCNTCILTKPKVKELKLDKTKKLQVEKKLDAVAIDLMVPARGNKGFVFVAIDLKTRYTVSAFAEDYTADTLLRTFKLLMMRLGGDPRLLILDKQSGFMSRKFTDYLLDKNIKFKTAPPHRHLEYNGVVERCIQSLRTMARASMTGSNLNTSFWPYAAIYATHLKNKMPHKSLAYKTPYEMYHGIPPTFEDIRTFGSVAFQILPLERRSGKFNPISVPLIFLGLDMDAGHSTGLLYDPKTKKRRSVHLQDLCFNEALTWDEYRTQRRPQLELQLDEPLFKKHSSYLCESESDSTSDSETSTINDGKEISPRSTNTVVHTSTDPANEDDNQPFQASSNLPTQQQANQIPSSRQPDFQGYVTRSGRVIQRPQRFDDDTDVALATIATTVDLTHRMKPRTDRQKKLLRRIVQSRKNKVPLTIDDIEHSPHKVEYMEAISKEMEAMKTRKVFTTVERSRVKPNEEIGKLIVLVTRKRSGRFKSRLVFNGRRQKFKITEYYSSPTLKQETLFVALSLAARRNYLFKTADVTTAFLYSDLPQGITLYAEIPKGHEDYYRKETCVLQIHKGLYGLKESPLLWWRHFNAVLKKNTSLKPSVYDECSFYGEGIIMLVYVDDILFLGRKQEINRLLKTLSKTFKLKSTNFDEPVDFLGCDLRKEGNTYILSQLKYVHNIIQKFHPDVEEKPTPLPVGFDAKTELNATPGNILQYQEQLGSLGYLRATRQDLLYSLHQLARYTHNPTTYLFQSMRNLFGYLKKTKNYERSFTEGGKAQLVAVVDAAFSNVDDKDFLKKSTGGGFIYYGHNMIYASSSTIRQQATSAPEAELYQILRITKTLIYLKGLHMDFGEKKFETAILTDSQSTVRTVNNPVSARYKYLSAFIGFIKWAVLQFSIRVVYLNREQNFADIMTKQGSCEEFTRHWNNASSRFDWTHNEVQKKQG